MLLTAFWVLGKNSWDRIPPDDSRRLLAADVKAEIRRGVARISGRRS
jgi:hypothetical protein